MAQINPIGVATGGQAASPPPAGTSVASITSDQALASLIHATLEGGGDQGKVAVSWLKQFLAANPATAKSIQPVK